MNHKDMSNYRPVLIPKGVRFALVDETLMPRLGEWSKPVRFRVVAVSELQVRLEFISVGGSDAPSQA